MILDFIVAIAWPIVVVLVAILYREQIRELIDRIRNLKVSASGISIDADAKSLARFGHAVVAAERHGGTRTADEAFVDAYVVDDEGYTAVTRVAFKWIQVHGEAMDAARRLELLAPHAHESSDVASIVRWLFEVGAVAVGTVVLADELQRLRQSARLGEISPDGADYFVKASDDLIVVLKFARRGAHSDG